MTRKEREALNDLSLRVYGRKSTWHTMVTKGEYRPETLIMASGARIEGKRWYPLTVEEVLARMEKVINDRNEAAKKAAEEALKQAQGETNGSEEKSVQGQEAGQPNEEVSPASTNG